MSEIVLEDQTRVVVAPGDTQVLVQVGPEDPEFIVQTDPVVSVVALEGGPPGLPGPEGPQGDQGPPGGDGGAAYVHTQTIPASVWTINHNLNAHPVVSVVDSANSQVEGTIDYPSPNQLILTFSGAFAGVAYLIS